MATVRLQLRRGTASQWTSSNPILASGEMGVETDTRKVKIDCILIYYLKL